MLILAFMLLFAAPVHAASLVWDNSTADGMFDVEFRATQNEPWTLHTTVWADAGGIDITKFGYYRIHIPGTDVVSNEARFSAEAVGSANLSVKALDADRLEIIGLNCKSLDTTGRGLKRILRCIH